MREREKSETHPSHYSHPPWGRGHEKFHSRVKLGVEFDSAIRFHSNRHKTWFSPKFHIFQVTRERERNIRNFSLSLPTEGHTP